MPRTLKLIAMVVLAATLGCQQRSAPAQEPGNSAAHDSGPKLKLARDAVVPLPTSDLLDCVAPVMEHLCPDHSPGAMLVARFFDGPTGAPVRSDVVVDGADAGASIGACVAETLTRFEARSGRLADVGGEFYFRCSAPSDGGFAPPSVTVATYF